MKILLAKHSGFCFGVRRAVEICRSAAAEYSHVYTWGNVIHNEQVVNELKSAGAEPIFTMDILKEGDVLVLRAHGVSSEIEEECLRRGVKVIDATCPFVKRIHQIVAVASKEGRHVFIAGQKDHPEVIGTSGRIKGPFSILTEPKDAALVNAEKACLVAQTTFEKEKYEEIIRVLSARIQDIEVHRTICDTTRLRQEETAILSQKCNIMLVLGSNTSANTNALKQICERNCQYTKMLDNSAQIPLAILNSNDIIGLVAGASTPDRMIREVIQGMSELEQTTIEAIEAEAPAEAVAETTEVVAEAAETIAAEETAPAAEPEVAPVAEAKDAETFDETAIDNSMRRIRPGQVVKGTVIGITENEILVSVGYKSDGYIPRSEYTAEEEAENPVKEGDILDVEVVKVNDGEGNVLLSRKNIQNRKFWDDLSSEENEGKILDAVVKEVVKGGLIAEIKGGVRAFVPASHVSLKFVENLNEYVGKEVKAKVLEVDKQRKRIVASIKQVLVEEQARKEMEKWDALVVGSKVHGVVRRITDFGAFVDIGGLDGLVHVTDAAWGRVKHPSDVLSINQEIDILILNVDKEKKRISLGYKQLQPKPWTMAGEKYPVGTIVEGKVVRIVPFGAFVALEPTIDGLIHISQVAVRRIEKVEDELKIGDVVRCKVLEVNPEAKRISLSRKEAYLEENPEEAEKLAAEKAERERIYQERKAQREARAEQQNAANTERKPRTERQPFASHASSEEHKDARPDRRRRNSEDGDYELPPVNSATTSLADLFAGFKTEE